MVKPSRVLLLIFFMAMNFFAESAMAQYQPNAEWLRNLEHEAVASGVSMPTVKNALSGATLNDRVLELDSRQPEGNISFKTYSKNILTASRLKKGRAHLKDNKNLLKHVSERYGVPPKIIVALWGIESGFGANTGGFNVIDSLITLSYKGRRTDFFRNELIGALKVLDQEHMDASSLSGSWAGAMGQCQFMPTTYIKYAVDYDGDGRRDIWGDKGDVFASIARYLAAEGWRSELTWGREVKLIRNISVTHIGLTATYTLKEWEKMGVRTAERKSLPQKSIFASLIQPDGAGGRSFLVYDNFRALMRWNRSTYFATTVGLLADRLNSSR